MFSAANKCVMYLNLSFRPVMVFEKKEFQMIVYNLLYGEFVRSILRVLLGIWRRLLMLLPREKRAAQGRSLKLPAVRLVGYSFFGIGRINGPRFASPVHGRVVKRRVQFVESHSIENQPLNPAAATQSSGQKP